VLNTKNNTLRMRTGILQAQIHYASGTKGLLARFEYHPPKQT